ncbi:amidohydrolase family protein [Enterobacteriaceae bacterium H11S18]|uniref:amidohydrolase family protein n=1 Tax=Dryocola clanedunensis TaxID=2925396 RepID=UPI0022F10393|nr:amidohydrolase family protein [Dryocola clanedunensis]MCT4709084.1 amidohydrolase family protein [Dryocola clanedunensis]
MYHGPIIDAHLHFWEPDKNNHPWLAKDAMVPFRYGDYSALKKKYLPDDYRRDCREHNIVASVYIDAEWDPGDPVGETRYIHALATQYKQPNAMVAQAWLDHPDVETVLSAQAQWPLVRSIRHKPAGPETVEAALAGQRTLMSSDKWLRGFAMLQPLGLHFDLQTPWWNFAEAARLARNFPDTMIILNHTGLPSDRTPEGLQAWHDAMALLAEQENIVVKISGLGQRYRPWTLKDNGWIIKETLAMFGYKRCMFASNFPVDSLCSTLNTVWNGFKSMTHELPVQEQSALFYENASRIYRISPLLEDDL